MRFQTPEILWLLLVLPPALVAFLWWAWRRNRSLLTRFIDTRLLTALVADFSAARRKLRFAFLIAAVGCLVFTLARPQWGFDWEETKQRGLDIVVAIDTSKSMLAEDIPPNRLARAKLAALDLMQQAKSDRLGLVAFAGTAFLECPLTVDDAAFRQSVDTLDVNTIPQGGTALAEAINVALAAFKQEDNYKVLVLFTDGEDHESGAAEAAKRAAEAGMRIFTIGIGTPGGELVRLTDNKGRSDYVRDEDGNVVKSNLNEPLLQEIAGMANGFYLPLRGANTMDTLYERGLAPLPKTESEAKLVKRYHERFYWPLLFAIGFLLAEMLFPERQSKARVATPASAAVRGTVRQAAAVVLLLLLPAAAMGSSAKALRDYEAGNYGEALKQYRGLIERGADDPRLHFNAGTAAYRDGQLEEAAKQFGEVLAAPDLKLQQDAYYNLGNTLFHMGERGEDPQKKIEAWEKSLNGYQNSLKLDSKDADARYNYDYVKRRLEELKKQQQDQQKQSDQKQDQNQEKQDQDQQKSDQAQQKQDKDQQQSKNQNEQKQDSQQQKDRQQEQQQAKQDQKQSTPDQKTQNEKRADSSRGQPQENKQPSEADESAVAAAGQMTPQQARQLLDAQKSDEGILLPKPNDAQPHSGRPFKDW